MDVITGIKEVLIILTVGTEYFYPTFCHLCQILESTGLYESYWRCESEIVLTNSSISVPKRKIKSEMKISFCFEAEKVRCRLFLFEAKQQKSETKTNGK
jgi:hypothetical protein